MSKDRCRLQQATARRPRFKPRRKSGSLFVFDVLIVAPHAPDVPGLRPLAAGPVAVGPRQHQPAVPVAPVRVAVFELDHVAFGRTRMAGRPGRPDHGAVSVLHSDVVVDRTPHGTLAPL